MHMEYGQHMMKGLQESLNSSAIVAVAGAYTRPLLTSTSAVSDSKPRPEHPLTSPGTS